MSSLPFSAILIALVLGYPAMSFGQSKGDFVIADSGGGPSLAYDLNGGIYVVWHNLNDAIHLKHLGPFGNTFNDSISFPNTGACLFPSVAVCSKYSVVAWDDRISNFIDYGYSDVYGSVIQHGSADTGYILLNPGGTGYVGGQVVSCLTDSTFLAAWVGNDPTHATVSAVFGQIVSVSGAKIGGNFIITDYINDSTSNALPRIIAEKNDKNFFVIWLENSPGHFNFYGRKFDFTGDPQDSSFLISDDTAITNLYYYSVALDTSGNFVVAWIADKRSKSQMQWRWYQGSGSPLTGVENLTPPDTLFSAYNSVDISIDEKNRIVLEWEQNNSTKSEFKIYAQRYLSNKGPLGNPFKVSANNAANDLEFYPNVMLKSGKLFSVWQKDTSGIMGSVVDYDSISLSVRNEKPANNPTESYSLHQNYPNPFNPLTVISYQLPASNLVTLKVYDELGRLMKTLVEDRETAGTHSATFDASKLSSGVYFYRLTAGSYVNTGKMMLLK